MTNVQGDKIRTKTRLANNTRNGVKSVRWVWKSLRGGKNLWNR